MMTAPSIEVTMSRLQAFANSNPKMAEATAFYRRLVPGLIRASAGIPPVNIPAEVLRKKNEAGFPLLAGEELAIDPEGSREVFLVISRALSSPGQLNTQALEIQKITDAVEAGRLELFSLLSFDDWGENTQVVEMAIQHGLEPHLLELLAQNTIKAYLRAWRPALETHIDLQHWQKTQCPICGSSPGLAEIQGVDRARYLRCMRCGAGWSYPNLTCAYCDNMDHRTLGILFVESEIQKYYMHTCDHCNRYIKTLISFEPTPVDELLIEDLATLQLDRLAKERGYF